MDNEILIAFMPLIIAVCVGLFATFLVIRNASKIGRGALGKVYQYFAFGMFLVLLGFIVELVSAWIYLEFVDQTSGILFIIGFAVMGVGANKILEAAGMK